MQRISVLSTSYGDCEAQPQSEANQFYVSLWQQAAAEGITVVVASGDTGGDGCQNVGAYATDGLSLVNEASTPYNIAAGGTDFSDVFSGTTSTYWSAVNGAQLCKRAIVYSGDDVERKLRQSPGAGVFWPGLREQLRAERILYLGRATAGRSQYRLLRPTRMPGRGAAG